MNRRKTRMITIASCTYDRNADATGVCCSNNCAPSLVSSTQKPSDQLEDREHDYQNACPWPIRKQSDSANNSWYRSEKQEDHDNRADAAQQRNCSRCIGITIKM